MKHDTTEGNPTEKYVLDSFAVLCYLRDEPGADLIADLLQDGLRGAVRLYMSWINLGEVYYLVQREEGPETAGSILEVIKSWPVELVEPKEADILAAGDIKARYPLSYADAFAAALAYKMQAPLLTGDPEFEKLERDQAVKIRWLPQKR